MEVSLLYGYGDILNSTDTMLIIMQTSVSTW